MNRRTFKTPGLMLITCPIMALLAISEICSAQDQIAISLQTGDTREVQAREQMQRILNSYHLSKWFFTRSVLILPSTRTAFPPRIISISISL